MSEIRRGQIYLLDMRYALNDINDCIRPVLITDIMEDPEAGRVYCTSPLRDPSKRKGKDIFFVSRSCGLRKDSVIDPEERRFVKEEKGFLRLIGELDELSLRSLEERLRGRRKTVRLGLVLRLCPKCLRDFMYDRNRIVKWLDSMQKNRDRCSYCSVGLGYEYLIYNRKQDV